MKLRPTQDPPSSATWRTGHYFNSVIPAMGPKHLVAALALTLGLGTVAVASRDVTTTSTECAATLDTEVCTWFVERGGTPLELGADIPLALIEGVAADVEMVWPPQPLAIVMLPAEARRLLGLDHMAINWEAHGHPPEAFLTQHFDFHFFNVGQDRVSAIDCSDSSKPGRIPAGYTLPDFIDPEMGVFIGLCVPQMGMHAIPEHQVHQTDAFDASMILGYYGGEPIFFEPMVSRDMLLRKADFELRLPQVEGLPTGVRYPTTLRARYDGATAAYRMVFTGFTAD